MEQSLKNRLTFGPAMGAGLLLMLWLDHAAQAWTRSETMPHGIGGIGITAILFLILPPATLELARLFSAEKLQPYKSIAAVGSLTMVGHAFLTQFPFFKPIAASSLAFIVVSIMLFAALRRAWGRQTQEAILRMAGTTLSALYLGGLSWFLVALRVKESADGSFRGTTMVVLMILLTVKATDIFAYFGGRALGRHKLIAWLSPKKTWEGLICGLLGAGLVGALCGMGMTEVAWWQGALFGVVAGGVGQLGDLLESLMKRDADVKDSGAMIPGFGGILDVIDSPLLAAPLAYLLFGLL